MDFIHTRKRNSLALCVCLLLASNGCYRSTQGTFITSDTGVMDVGNDDATVDIASDILDDSVIEDVEHDTHPSCIDPACSVVLTELLPACHSESEWSQFVQSNSDNRRIHIIAVYGSPEDGSGDNPETEIEVRVDCTASPIVLALHSHNPITWVVERTEYADIEIVYLLRMHSDLFIRGVEDVPVETIIVDPPPVIGLYYWPSCDEWLSERMYDETGLEIAAFGGCYEGTSFTLSHYCAD